MAANEQTSKRVARIAGKVMARLKNVPSNPMFIKNTGDFAVHLFCKEVGITLVELSALAASALTQAADRRRK